MSRLMRCIRVGGVILYSFDNGHFMAYTSPPPTAEPLLKEKPFGECTSQLSPIAVQRLHSYSTRPRGTLIADQRRACAARPKGKYSRGRMALAPIRTREFSLPRGPIHRPRLPVLFQQLSRHTQPSLILSWAPRKNRSPSSLLPFVPPRPTQKAPPIGRGFACGVKP